MNLAEITTPAISEKNEIFIRSGSVQFRVDSIFEDEMVLNGAKRKYLRVVLPVGELWTGEQLAALSSGSWDILDTNGNVMSTQAGYNELQALSADFVKTDDNLAEIEQLQQKSVELTREVALVTEQAVQAEGMALRIGNKLRVVADDLPDSLASKYPEIYFQMAYAGELIPHGTRINWDGALKRAAVDLWDREDQNPDNAPTLWEDINYHKGYRVIPEVITATLQFAKNEIGYWPPDGKFYRAKADGTVWTPTAYPAGWEKVTIDGDTIWREVPPAGL